MHGYRQDGQSVDAQVKQLRDAGAEKFFRETASRAKSDRVQLRRALDQLGKGDVLMVTQRVQTKAAPSFQKLLMFRNPVVDFCLRLIFSVAILLLNLAF